ncbi:MAG: DUF4139 domain-containing protein [Deltaproteobacteria bacterium]|nr:DUF4139 domain-containing protein [Deltaproteobacteria bacterium]MBK8716692.1 DUF4139 domain-containing protein [Deltaproteobacteria bacterium]MBP7285341.1 DUF4139 domain-containing protein [Nannocystaceae bacterium]
MRRSLQLLSPLSRTPALWLSLLALAPAIGCAHGRSAYPTAETDLALHRVVLYRNGIGYFERHGEVDGDALAIKVRRDQVDDLLKSLTVIDRSTGKAMSVSMPLDPESWANAALSQLGPGRGSLAEVLDGLRGTEVVVRTHDGTIRGRIVMVETIQDEPDPYARPTRGGGGEQVHQRDHRLTLLQGNDMHTVRLSKVHGVTLKDGDLALQLNRRLDASAGEGMFQQVEIVIRLAGKKAHDLAVSYVVAAPMWKPTYRVVLPKEGNGDALLQGWAVVDNTSGEDWNDVSLGLTSGEPIAFQYDLHTPRTIQRADLTEAGVSRRAIVAVGETTYSDAPEEVMPAPPPASAPATAAADEYQYEDDVMAGESGGGGDARASSVRSKAKMEPRAYDKDAARDRSETEYKKNVEQAIDYDALRRSTMASARSKQISGLTSFDLRERVTVPNGNSTMVAILNQSVGAEQTFLYRPGGAGVGYEANPYRVVRFRNSTPFVLEPGPISIYSGDSFVGEGLSESVGAGMSATLPFAVEPGIMVTSTASYSGDEMQLLRIVRGVLEVESFARTTTKWTVKAPKSMGTFSVLVRHGKAGWNYELVDPPKGTEALPDAYLVPVPVTTAGQEGEVTLVEQTPSVTTLSIWDVRAVSLLEGLVAKATLTAALRKQLEPIVKLRQEIGRIDTEIDGLKRQQVELDQRANETRENLEAIKKDPAAGSLRSKLNARLDAFTKDGDRIGRKVVELNSQRLEKKIALEDLLQGLEFEAPKASSK